MKKKILLLQLIFLTVIFIFSEDLKVDNLKIIEITTKSVVPQTFEIQASQTVAVSIDKDAMFLQGVEIEIHQSQETLNSATEINCFVYNSISLKPTPELTDYKAQKIYEKKLPVRKSVVLQVPVSENHYLQESAFAMLLPYKKNNEHRTFIFQFNSANNSSDDKENKKNDILTISVRPLLTNEGGLSVNLKHPDPEEPKTVAITLNGRYAEIPSSPKFLSIPTGDYQLIFNSDAYRSEMRTCKVEQGKITELTVELCSIIPILHINIPEEAQAFLDKEKIIDPTKPIRLSAGKHTVKIVIGNYETIRQIIAEEGKTYKLEMKVEIEIQTID